MNQISSEIRPDARPHHYVRVIFLFLIVVAIVPCVLFLEFNAPRADFPAGKRITVPEGSTLADISKLLKEERAIRSALLFQLFIRHFDKETSLHAGRHILPHPATTLEVARAFAEGRSLVPAVRVTIPEGSTLAEFDAIIHEVLPHIPKGAIVEAAGGKEGVLFPDTYEISETDTAEDVVELLSTTLTLRLASLAPLFVQSSLSEEEVIILASIVEREANDVESMQIVAGILLSRLELDMPLQVDATFHYLSGKTSAELTEEDLESESPFNTYENRGLPPSPIASPGMTAIRAVLEPQESEYLYYLTAPDGSFYYAETFEGHKRNKELYLR